MPVGFRWTDDVSHRPSRPPRPAQRYVPSQEELVASLPNVTRWERVSAALLLTVASVPAAVVAPAVTMRTLASLIGIAARKGDA
jgi:hypothetical protein